MASESSGSRGVGLKYLPGLDGLRALAVIAVLIYHAEARWLPGGFLGVELFFVISGYLITSLLLAEWQRRGGIDLKGFWLRRARRLLPALFVLVVSVLTFAVLFLPAEVAGLRREAAAAAGYATNWYLVLSHTSYFESVGRPSLLRHLWSLAVEEQFYLLWPLLFVAGMRFLRPRKMLPAILVAAAGSAALMAVLYQPGADPSRVYYGTDTRAAGLFIGASLAFVWAPRQGQGSPSSRIGRPWPDLAGLAALGGLLAFAIRIDEYAPVLYRGGFALFALLSAAAIAAVVHPEARLLTRVLGSRPLRWIGQRSYGIYLWHWPVFMVTRPQLDVSLGEPWLSVLRLAVTLTLAELSFRLVERPLRSDTLLIAWKRLHEAHGGRRLRLGLSWSVATIVILASFTALGDSVVRAQPSAPPAYLAIDAVDTVSTAPAAAATLPSTQEPASPALALPDPATPTLAPASATPAPTATPSARVTATATAPLLVAATAGPSPITTTVAMTRPASAATPQAVEQPGAGPAPTGQPVVRTTAIGDSVMVGAAPALQQAIPGIEIDARQGRQASAAIDVLKARREAGQLGQVVIIHIGSNGTLSAKEFDEMMGVLEGTQEIVFVNVKVPRAWQEPNNTVLAEGAKRYANVIVVDWLTASAEHPEYFWGDGIHLRQEGAKIYAGLIAGALQANAAS